MGREMRFRVATSAVAVAALWLLGGTVASHAAKPSVESLLERFRASVVPVKMTLRPVEPPPGGEGQKVEEVFCGVIADEDGLVVLSGDAFPEPGSDPETTLEPVAFAVIDSNEVEHPLIVEGLNRDLNLAYLRFPDGLPAGYRPVRFQENPEPRLGEQILIIGLLPERYDFARTFWTGQVSARIESPRSMYAVTTFVQDLSIGGLAVDLRGTVLGLVAEDVLPGGQAGTAQTANPLTLFGSLSQGPRVGYPMIFPHRLFAADLESPPPLVREPPRAWLGITMQPLQRELREYWGIDNPGGIIVSSILDGSPAQGAGLRPRDIILRLGDSAVTARQVPHLASFRQSVEKLPIGEEVELTVWRDGEQIALTLHPGVAPRTGFLARDYEDPDFGLTVRELTIDVLQARNLPFDTKGVLISEMENGSWAQVAGLGPMDIILRVDDTTVSDLGSFREVMDALRQARPRETYFFVQRNVETRFVTVRTSW